jgi:hypothetical protein
MIKGLALLFMGAVAVGITVSNAQAALLDGMMGGLEESLAERVSKNGEKLKTGNFYTAERPDSHAPIGVMQDHTHDKGEFMFTYRYMLMYMDQMRDGTDNLSINDVQKDFLITPKNMRTQMHMFSAMYGLNDTVTLMVMLPYVLKKMEHERRDGLNFTTNSSGFGDTKLAALWRLYAFEAPSIGSHKFHLNTGVSLPTGDINPTDHTPMGNDSLLPYPMRLGSGTVDLLPGLTYTGSRNDVSWGLQGLGTVRIGHNNEGYKEGNRYQVNSWGAYRWAKWISTSVRFNWQQWYNIKRKDGNLLTTNMMGVPIVPTADTDRQAGKRLDLMGGVNILFPEFMGLENHLNVEAGAPIYQYLDGPQLRQSYSVWGGWQVVFN